MPTPTPTAIAPGTRSLQPASRCGSRVDVQSHTPANPTITPIVATSPAAGERVLAHVANPARTKYTTKTPSSVAPSRSVGFGAASRTSPQASRCVPMRTRKTLRVAYSRIGTPTMSAYHAEWDFEALSSELETMPPTPSLLATPFGESDEVPAITP